MILAMAFVTGASDRLVFIMTLVTLLFAVTTSLKLPELGGVTVFTNIVRQIMLETRLHWIMTFKTLRILESS